jgi:hypothetical protein
VERISTVARSYPDVQDFASIPGSAMKIWVRISPGIGGGRGDMPQGGFIFGEGGGGGMGEPGGMAMDGRADPSLQATRQAGMPSRQLGGGNPMLVRAVIELLQRKLPAADG